MKQETITNAHEMHSDSVLIIQAFVLRGISMSCPITPLLLSRNPLQKVWLF